MKLKQLHCHSLYCSMPFSLSKASVTEVTFSLNSSSLSYTREPQRLCSSSLVFCGNWVTYQGRHSFRAKLATVLYCTEVVLKKEMKIFLDCLSFDCIIKGKTKSRQTQRLIKTDKSSLDSKGRGLFFQNSFFFPRKKELSWWVMKHWWKTILFYFSLSLDTVAQL